MDKKDRRSEQIKVMVTGAELMALAKRAGSEPLSSYCRRVLVDSEGNHVHGREGIEPMKMPEVPVEIQAAIDPGEAVNTLIESAHEEKPLRSHRDTDLPVAPKRKKREAKKCPHGEPEGNNCWRCGGLAKIV